MSWHVYIVECKDGTLYTGCTTDLDRRLKKHNSGQGAKYTRGRGPVKLRLSFPARDRATAQKLERWIKRLPAEDKRRLTSQLNRSRKILACGCPEVGRLVVRTYPDGRRDWGYACSCGKTYRPQGRL